MADSELLRESAMPEEADSNAVAAVDTLNTGKIAAVDRALAALGFTHVTQGVDVPSGVSEQPVGMAETAQGARNRAQAALAAAEGAALGVGLESGVLELDGQLLDFCACAITDIYSTWRGEPSSSFGGGPALLDRANQLLSE